MAIVGAVHLGDVGLQAAVCASSSGLLSHCDTGHLVSGIAGGGLSVLFCAVEQCGGEAAGRGTVLDGCRLSGVQCAYSLQL